MAAILCVGNAVLDYIYAVDALPTRGEKYRARDLTIVGGGLAGNAAAAVARLGGTARLLSRLGADSVGDTIVGELEGYGVDCRFVQRVEGVSSPCSAVFVEPNGERMVVSHSAEQLTHGFDALPAGLLDGIDAIHCDYKNAALVAAVLGRAAERHLPSVLDADRVPDDVGILGLASHVGFSRNGLMRYSGTGDLRDGLREAARRIRAMNSQSWIGVTDGARGIYYMDHDMIRHEGGFHVEVVDTLGAGDTWHGALALALAEGQPAHETLRFANAAAALKCTRFGGRLGIPTRAEVDGFLKEHPPRRPPA